MNSSAPHSFWASLMTWSASRERVLASRLNSEKPR
jgi:hypothetical protein